MTSTIDDLITQIRRGLDEVTMTGQATATDTDIQDTLASNFSDEDLKDRLISGVRFIASRVQASTIPEFIETLSPSDISVPMDETAPYVLRLLGSRIEVDGIQCDRRTFSGHRKMESSGREASANYPIFTFESFELLMSAGGGGTTKEAHYVRVPGRNVKTDGSSADPYADITKLPDRYENALVLYVLSSCFKTLLKFDLVASTRKQMYQSMKNNLLRKLNQTQNEDS